jgi:2-polyprenyl-3-methyl-5-hydroxy-6-metoxy-1,4-benzoquinol methylase
LSIVKQKCSRDRLNKFFNEAYWFHTIDLGDGTSTKGVYDIRPIVDLHGFDPSLAGKSVLDVGSSDGFYAFEFARRGAQEVLAVDTNAYDGTIPTDVSPSKRERYAQKYSREKEEYERFKDIFSVLGLKGANKLIVLADYLDSIVRFQQHSIYELNSLGRTFDFVFCGGLFGHLKNPLQGIEQLRAVTAEKCIITVNGSLPQTHTKFGKLRIKFARIMLKTLRVYNHFSENEHDFILRYIGNQAGGSFFHIHPSTFKQMLLASGFKTAEIHSDYQLMDGRIQVPQRGCVFHCTV